jgi:hypothetical protein
VAFQLRTTPRTLRSIIPTDNVETDNDSTTVSTRGVSSRVWRHTFETQLRGGQKGVRRGSEGGQKGVKRGNSTLRGGQKGE